ncbi:MAG TPA: hypothetical protein VNS88_11980 [Nitrospiraceae bacterium]|nr:hypothetical protein [Nitrospiraceae bacterium]
MPDAKETAESRNPQVLADNPSQFALSPPASGPYRDNNLLYAAGDVVVWAGLPNVGAPVGFEDPSGIVAATYKCLGWVDVSGYIFKLDETLKDIPAAGVLTPIRSILTGGTKTAQATFLEGMNPNVLALYDDVPIFPATTSPLKASTTAVSSLPINSAVYVIPDPPADNRYSLIFDSVDGTKQERLYAPFAKVTARGNRQAQQGDIITTDLTFTFYPGTIGSNTSAVAQRAVNYGKAMSTYFT